MSASAVPTARAAWQHAAAAVLVVAVVVTLIVGAELWERPRGRRVRKQVLLFNVATAATVVLGVLSLYTVLFLLGISREEIEEADILPPRDNPAADGRRPPGPDRSDQGVPPR